MEREREREREREGGREGGRGLVNQTDRETVVQELYSVLNLEAHVILNPSKQLNSSRLLAKNDWYLL